MKVLVPFDGSELAESALPVAKTLATELVLLRVLDLVVINVPELAIRLKESETQLAKLYLERLQLRLEGVPMKSRIEVGTPREMIPKVADEEGCEMIVMASHGRTGMKRWLLGSVAEAVLRHANCPVLLVRGDNAEFRNVLVPVDGSEASRKVVSRLGGYVQKDAKITLVQATGARLHEKDLDKPVLHTYLSELEQSLKKLGSYEVVVVDDEAAQTILEQAEERGCDLIAMTTHVRSGLQKLFLGSVTEKVVRHAHCPVLVFPPT